MASFFQPLISVARTSSKAAFDKCKDAPGECVRQILIDVTVLIFMFGLTVYAAEGINVFTKSYFHNKVSKYFVIYVLCSFMLRYLDTDYEDALSRGAAMLISGKLISIMNP